MKIDIIHTPESEVPNIDLDISDKETKRLIGKMIKKKQGNPQIIEALAENNPKLKDMILNEHEDVSWVIMAIDSMIDQIRAFGWKPQKWHGTQAVKVPQMVKPKSIVRGS